jgi:hypothetical protein
VAPNDSQSVWTERIPMLLVAAAVTLGSGALVNGFYLWRDVAVGDKELGFLDRRIAALELTVPSVSIEASRNGYRIASLDDALKQCMAEAQRTREDVDALRMNAASWVDAKDAGQLERRIKSLEGKQP